MIDKINKKTYNDSYLNISIGYVKYQFQNIHNDFLVKYIEKH